MSSVFPQWQPAPCELAEEEPTHLAFSSVPLLPGDSSAHSPLALFGSLPLARGEAPVEADTVCFAGAPVWALDWRPSSAGEDASSW
jgi:hypothetical protein